MAEYTKGLRVSLEVTLVGEYEYEDTFGYYSTTKFIYTFKDSEGNTLVWKTGCVIGIDIGNDNYCAFDPVYRGDRIKIKATVKELSEYKGEPQVVLTRVKVVSFLKRALTKEEKEEIKSKEQLATLKENDIIYEMPYRQYKERYADCETLAGSYNDEFGTIKVIVREGRLKPSGVRGKHFKGYEFTDESGNKVVYRAVSEENALKRAQKDFPDCNWKCTRVYDYRYNRSDYWL